MDARQISELAEKCNADGDKTTAVVLFTLAGAKILGTDKDLANIAAEFAKIAVRDFDYAKWLKEG